MTPMCKPYGLFTCALSRFSYTDKTEMMEVYTGDRKISSASTASETRTATIQLLHGLVDRMRTLGPRPYDARIIVKLSYYDEVTPDDYEPPGFTSAETDLVYMEGIPGKLRLHTDPIYMEGTPGKFRLQTVSTAFHSLQVHVIAAPEDSVGDVEPNGVRCPCLVDAVDGVMILCTVCRYWQHAICFKILDEHELPEHPVCNLCCSPSTPATDPELCQLDQATAQDVCLWRRSLAACLEVSYISVGQLAHRLGVTDAVASRLLGRLETEGYATARGQLSGGWRYVKKSKIMREALAKYLSSDNDVAMGDVEPNAVRCPCLVEP